MLLLEQATSFAHLLSWPSTILLDHVVGLALLAAFSSNTLALGLALLLGDLLGRDVAGGAAAAMWIATSRANSWKSSLRATKSVSHWTSTSTPDLAAGVDVGGDDALARSPGPSAWRPTPGP